ncbi:PCI-domain-containing protein [Lenzites betulinus]|nr:PCI-domain-containing protein [Lenzites betulinus]
MADPKKQEKDFTKEVDALLKETTTLAGLGKLQDALDKIYVLEKQTRNASDLKSTTRLVKEASELAYKARDFKLLNSSISSLSKKHGQLKAAIQALVEQAYEWLEDIRKTQGTETWLELIETLRTVTEGKIFLETPRARVTLLLAHHHETIATASTATPVTRKESLQVASDLLSDLQVETYSSMDRREKTEFLLEQMRFLIALANLKDGDIGKDGKDSIGGGEAEWVKVRVGGRKVNEEFLKDKANEDLKLKYYDMMIQYALHAGSYLDAAKHYHKVWETPTIKEDVNGRGREALEHIVYYVVLAPHDNEQSDMLHRLFADPALPKLELHYALVKCFTTPELMRWPGIEAIYGPHLRTTAVFSSEKLWEDLHTRVIEHNIRIVSQYYTRITLARLTSLLDLTQQQTEEVLCRLVVSATIWARIDRPAGIVNFRSSRSAEDVMNDWSSDMQRLLGLVEKTWMGVNAAQAAQSRAVKAAS